MRHNTLAPPRAARRLHLEPRSQPGLPARRSRAASCGPRSHRAPRRRSPGRPRAFPPGTVEGGREGGRASCGLASRTRWRPRQSARPAGVGGSRPFARRRQGPFLAASGRWARPGCPQRPRTSPRARRGPPPGPEGPLRRLVAHGPPGIFPNAAAPLVLKPVGTPSLPSFAMRARPPSKGRSPRRAPGGMPLRRSEILPQSEIATGFRRKRRLSPRSSIRSAAP